VQHSGGGNKENVFWSLHTLRGSCPIWPRQVMRESCICYRHTYREVHNLERWKAKGPQQGPQVCEDCGDRRNGNAKHYTLCVSSHVITGWRQIAAKRKSEENKTSWGWKTVCGFDLGGCVHVAGSFSSWCMCCRIMTILFWLKSQFSVNQNSFNELMEAFCRSSYQNRCTINCPTRSGWLIK